MPVERPARNARPAPPQQARHRAIPTRREQHVSLGGWLVVPGLAVTVAAVVLLSSGVLRALLLVTIAVATDLLAHRRETKGREIKGRV